MTLRDQGKPPSPPPSRRPTRLPPLGVCGLQQPPGWLRPRGRSSRPSEPRRPGQAPGSLGARVRRGDAGGWRLIGQGIGLRTDATLEPGEELTPCLEGRPGDRELLQSHSHPEGDRCETLSGAAPSSSPRATNSRVSFLLGSTGLMASLHLPSSGGT